MPHLLTVVNNPSQIASATVAEGLVGMAEIADLLGVSRQRAHKITQREDFPEPVAKLAAGHIWKAADVRRWVREHREV